MRNDCRRRACDFKDEEDLDPVYTVSDPLGHDIKFNSFKTSVTLKTMVILQNLITTNHRKSGRSKNNLKLTEIIVVTT
jgi:hypothetical protein